ncbi:hypothetical protein ISCGN_006942, partial [Ixodes scapularis]
MYDNAALANEFELPFSDLTPTEREMLLRTQNSGLALYEGAPDLPPTPRSPPLTATPRPTFTQTPADVKLLRLAFWRLLFVFAIAGARLYVSLSLRHPSPSSSTRQRGSRIRALLYLDVLCASAGVAGNACRRRRRSEPSPLVAAACHGGSNRFEQPVVVVVGTRRKRRRCRGSAMLSVWSPPREEDEEEEGQLSSSSGSNNPVATKTVTTTKTTANAVATSATSFVPVASEERRPARTVKPFTISGTGRKMIR